MKNTAGPKEQIMAIPGQKHINHKRCYSIALILFKLISLASVVFIQIARPTGNEYEFVIRVHSYPFKLLIWDEFHFSGFRCLDIITLYSTLAGNHVEKLVVRAYSN
jgi:hypothetical protein